MSIETTVLSKGFNEYKGLNEKDTTTYGWADANAGTVRIPLDKAAERTIESQGRLENLDELVNVAAEYQGQADDPSLSGFLEEIALQSDADLVDKLPLLFRTLRGKRISAGEIKKLIRVIRGK